MMYRLRAVVCALAGITVFTCIASVKWFLVTDHLVEQRASRASAPPGKWEGEDGGEKGGGVKERWRGKGRIWG